MYGKFKRSAFFSLRHRYRLGGGNLKPYERGGEDRTAVYHAGSDEGSRRSKETDSGVSYRRMQI